MPIEDFTELKNLSVEKLIKLRDVLGDEVVETFNAHQEAVNRWNSIKVEIANRITPNFK